MLMTYNVEHPEHAWLTLAKSDLKNIKNPLIDLTQKELDHLHLHVLRLMKQPKYFQWTVKKVIINGEFKDCWITTGVSRPLPITESA